MTQSQPMASIRSSTLAGAAFRGLPRSEAKEFFWNINNVFILYFDILGSTWRSRELDFTGGLSTTVSSI